MYFSDSGEKPKKLENIWENGVWIKIKYLSFLFFLDLKKPEGLFVSKLNPLLIHFWHIWMCKKTAVFKVTGPQRMKVNDFNDSKLTVPVTLTKTNTNGHLEVLLAIFSTRAFLRPISPVQNVDLPNTVFWFKMMRDHRWYFFRHQNILDFKVVFMKTET